MASMVPRHCDGLASPFPTLASGDAGCRSLLMRGMGTRRTISQPLRMSSCCGHVMDPSSGAQWVFGMSSLTTSSSFALQFSHPMRGGNMWQPPPPRMRSWFSAQSQIGGGRCGGCQGLAGMSLLVCLEVRQWNVLSFSWIHHMRHFAIATSSSQLVACMVFLLPKLWPHGTFTRHGHGQLDDVACRWVPSHDSNGGNCGEVRVRRSAVHFAKGGVEDSWFRWAQEQQF